jgi:deazaflavin-dependent oxidoreductase (nitroreductase family)
MTGSERTPARPKLRNQIFILLNRAGLRLGPVYLLTVLGRRSGQPRTNPLAPVIVDGTPYLVQAYPNADWVKNARAAGHGVLTRGRHAQPVTLEELPVHERGSILREFPTQNPWGVAAFVRSGLVDSASPESFAAAAARCPVFRAVPRPAEGLG